MGARDYRDLHGRCVRDVPVFRAREYRDAVRAWLHNRRRPIRPRARGRERHRERARIRFLLRPAALHVFSGGRSIHRHLCSHADRDRRHRQPHGERASANARRRRARAAHCVAVCDEPRACGDARRRQHGARRSQTRCRSLRLQSGRAAAGREKTTALSRRCADRRFVSGRRPVHCAVGRRSWQARGTWLRYVACGAGAVCPVER